MIKTIEKEIISKWENSSKIRILAITSSPHRNGNTCSLTHECLKELSRLGASVEEIYLPDYNLNQCLGCMMCLQQEDCVQKDDLNYIKHLIIESDGIIMSSPTYGMMPNARMINLYQRLGIYNVYRSAFGGKYIAAISTAGGIGAKKNADFLLSFNDGLFRNGRKIGSIAINIGWKTIDEYLPKTNKLAKRIFEAIKKRKTYPFQGLLMKILRFLFIERIMIKNLRGKKDKEMKGVYEFLITHKIIK